MRETLRRRMNVAPPDVEIAPLANAEQPATDETVLAARFPDQDAAEAAELLKNAGGEIVANVDERWTLPRSTSPSPMNGQNWGTPMRRSQLQV